MKFSSKSRVFPTWRRCPLGLVSIMVLVTHALIMVPARSMTATEESGMRVFHDIEYTKDSNNSQSLDLFLPKQVTANPIPVVILIHGGGWLGGDKKDFAGLAHDFVTRGFAVASLNYRLSNQNKWPAQIIDCKAAVRWLRSKADYCHIDPNRFAVGGHSAGGHLAAFLAATNGVKDFDKGANLQVSSDVQAVLWFAGIADLISRASTSGFEIVQNKASDQSQLIGGPTLENRELAMQASPITWVSKKTAPFFFESGTADNVVPCSQISEMNDALKKYHIYSEVHLLQGVGHFGPEFFDRTHIDLMDKFLKKVLKLDRHASRPVCVKYTYLSWRIHGEHQDIDS